MTLLHIYPLALGLLEVLEHYSNIMSDVWPVRILSESHLLYLLFDPFNLIISLLFNLIYLLDVRDTISIVINQQFSLHCLEAPIESFHLRNTAWRNNFLQGHYSIFERLELSSSNLIAWAVRATSRAP